jgi:hypothetical protein
VPQKVLKVARVSTDLQVNISIKISIIRTSMKQSCVATLENFLPFHHKYINGVCSTCLRSLYLQCDISTNPKIFSSRSCFFSSRSKILILLYVVSKLMQKIPRFHGKTARYDVLKIKFEDISHHR